MLSAFTMQKLLNSAIFRSVRPQRLTHASTFGTVSDDALDSICNKVIAVVNSEQNAGPVLEKLDPFLNRETVISVIQSLSQFNKDPRVCFWFFVWTAGKARLRSGVSQKLIVSMLMSDCNENIFDLYWSVLDEVRNAKLPVPADAFVVMMLGYWRLKKAEKAVETFGRMKNYECEPNIAAYNVILHVSVNKDVILALAVYNMLLKSNCRMGCDTFNIFIDGLCKGGMNQEALSLFYKMTARGITPNTITYTVVISGLCKAKRTHDAHKVFNLMKSNGCRPDSAAYNTLLDGFCKQGQIDEALMLLKSFKNDGHNEGMREFSCLIDGLIRAKRVGDAEELFRKVLDMGLAPDLIMYSVMMRGLCNVGRIGDARKMLRDMIEKGVVPDTQCYNALIKGYCDLGWLDEARSLLLEISQHDQFPDTHTYTILISGLCKKGLLGEAQQILKDMDKLGCSPSVTTFNALIDGLCKACEVEEAQQTLSKMEIGKNPPLLLRLSRGSLIDRVQSMVESGSIHKAYLLLSQLSDSGVRPNTKTYNTLINGRCKAGQVNAAVNYFKELQLQGNLPDTVTFSTLINWLLREKREGDAHKLFELMKKKGCKPTPQVYKTLVTWSCRRVKTTDAFNLWLEYLRTLADCPSDALKSAEELFKKGDMEKVVRSLLEVEIKLVDFDSGFYNIWLIGLCQANRVEEALRTFFVLKEFSVIVHATGCVHLIRLLCSAGKLKEAACIFRYTMQKGYQLTGAYNRLLQDLLKSKDQALQLDALELRDEMKHRGYNLHSCLHRSTEIVLNNLSRRFTVSEG